MLFLSPTKLLFHQNNPHYFDTKIEHTNRWYVLCISDNKLNMSLAARFSVQG